MKRSEGRNAVASAAYRSASALYEEATGITHDYRHKQGVAHTEILAPEGAAAWVFDRRTLWNTVEAAELRKDSQVARDVEIRLPVELNAQQQIALPRDFAQREFVARGRVSSWPGRAAAIRSPQTTCW